MRTKTHRLMAVGIGTLVLVGSPLGLTPSAHAGALVAQTDAMTQLYAQIELARLGVTPQALCVLGFTPAQGEVFTRTLAGVIAGELAALQTAESTLDGARTALAAAKRDLGDEPSAAELAQVQAAQAAVDAAKSVVDGIRTGFEQSVQANLTAAQRVTLAMLRGNAKKRVPLEYKVIDRPDAQWTELRDCLVHVDQLGSEADSQAVACVSNAGSASAVITARYRLSVNLDAMTLGYARGVEDGCASE